MPSSTVATTANVDQEKGVKRGVYGLSLPMADSRCGHRTISVSHENLWTEAAGNNFKISTFLKRHQPQTFYKKTNTRPIRRLYAKLCINNANETNLSNAPYWRSSFYLYNNFIGRITFTSKQKKRLNAIGGVRKAQNEPY